MLTLQKWHKRTQISIVRSSGNELALHIELSIMILHEHNQWPQMLMSLQCASLVYVYGTRNIEFNKWLMDCQYVQFRMDA